MLAWTLAVTLPFDGHALVSYLQRRLVGGVEQIRGHTYQRVLELGDEFLDVEVGLEEAARTGVVTIRASCGPQSVKAVSDRVTWLLDAAWDPASAAGVLRRDAALVHLVQRRPGLRVVGSMAPFEVAVRAVVGQQISVAAATTIMSRIVQRFGNPVTSVFEGIRCTFPSPQGLLGADLEQCGLAPSRSSAIRALAELVAAGSLALERPAREDWHVRFQAIRGIGPWTTSYVALRAFGVRDSIPVADLGLRRALADDPRHPFSTHELAIRSRRWSPYRGVAAMHGWTSLLLDEPPNSPTA